MSGVDRLAELRGAAGEVDEPAADDVTVTISESTASEAAINQHMKRYDTIKRSLTIIKSNADAIEKLRNRNKQTANDKARAEISAAMDKIVSSVNNESHAIKKKLDEIKAENDAFKRENRAETATIQMRSNLYQTHIRRFQSVMQEYNSAAHNFKSDLQKRTRREIKIVDNELTEEEIDDIVQSGAAQDVIKQALVSDNLQDVVRVIEERHADILKLEQQVLEIYELFRDLASLVDLQQESLDVIENRIMSARNYTEKAEADLNEAEDYQKKARNRRCCILLVIIGILVVVLAPTLGTTLGNA